MRLGSLPLRLAGCSSAISTCLRAHTSTCAARLLVPLRSEGHTRPSSTVASLSSLSLRHPPTDDTDDKEDGPRRAAATATATPLAATGSTSTSPVAHLKRRGHFLPPLVRDPPPASRWGLSHHGGGGQPLVGAQHYGQWRELLFDYDRLLFESGLVPASLSAGQTQRAVDQPEHAGDMSLWSALFNFAQRRGGDGAGALVVWREVFQRRELHQTDGVVAGAFWQAVAASAVAVADEADEAFLESTWAYAEWMRDEHGALWPHYYRTVVTFCLENEQYGRALRWHMRLSAHFGLAKRDFFDLLRGFLADPDPELQDTLRSMYVTSRHRMLYDTIVPLLWSRGCSALARRWRETLVRHDDWPTSGASRPFLQYLAGYYPETELCAQEQVIASAQQPRRRRLPAGVPRSGLGLHAAGRAPDLPSNLYYLLNRVHGDTFGIEEKSFNDKIGSKWFATSWVSLDTAINLVYGLGIHEIGPLSLQSIALREGSPAGIVRRIQQLAEHHIGLGPSSYAKAVRYFAQTGDAETLNALLRSTLHPDVFDDVVLQRHVMGSATFTGDWKTHWLLMAVRVAVSEHDMVRAANRLLLACLDRPPRPPPRRNGAAATTALKLLDEFAARGIELLPSTCETISHLVLAEVPRQFHAHAAPRDVDFYVGLCRRLATLRLPVATEAWQNILFLLGRQGRLADLEAVAVEIVDHYAAVVASSTTSSPSSPDTAVFKVHVSDVPSVVRGGGGGSDDGDNGDNGDTQQSSDLGYRLLPRDLPLHHPLHPLSLLFSRSLVEGVVRWYFHRKTAYRQAAGRKSRTAHVQRRVGGGGALLQTPTPLPPAAFAMAGGIRLLAMLRDRGLAVPAEAVRSETLVCIAAVFGPPAMASRYWQPARAANQLTLREVKDLCDAAWARTDTDEDEEEQTEPLLPSVEALEKALEAVRPVAESFGSRLTRPGEKKKLGREVFINAIGEA